MANSESQFELLESKINTLIAQFEKINAENDSLNHRIRQMQTEKEQLISKNESARKQIDLMIHRLRAM